MAESIELPDHLTKPQHGVLTAVVFACNGTRIYVSHHGAPDELELAANIAPGGDWDEANVYHEDAPPYPPADGLWQLILPWRRLTCEEREADSELCCIYKTKPQWVRIDEPMQDALRFHALVRSMFMGTDEDGNLSLEVQLDFDFLSNIDGQQDVAFTYPWLRPEVRDHLIHGHVNSPITAVDKIRAIDFHLRGIGG